MNLDALREVAHTAVVREEEQALRELAVGKDVLEIGSYLGFSTIVMASVAKSVTSVDNHQMEGTILEGSFSRFLANLATYELINDVTIIVAPAQRALPLLAPKSFDLIFIDGGHEYAQVKSDVVLSLPLLRPGGIMAFHDYGPVHGDVKLVVDDLLPAPLSVVWSLAIVQP